MQVVIKYANPEIEGYTVHLSPAEAWAFPRIHDLSPASYGLPLRELLSALKSVGVGAA